MIESLKSFFDNLPVNHWSSLVVVILYSSCTLFTFSLAKKEKMNVERKLFQLQALFLSLSLW